MPKKILIATHEYSGIYKNMVWDLEANNFDVELLLYSDSISFKFRSIKDLVMYFFHKKNKAYKQFVFEKYREYDLVNQLKELPNNYYDCCLFIRADFYTTNTIKEAIRVSKKAISYHWDGLDRFPKIHSLINLFDDFYVFEENDLEKYQDKYSNLKLASNFYFVHNNSQKKYPKTDVFYIGEFLDNRKEDILNIYSILKNLELGLKIKIMFWSQDDNVIKKYQNDDIIFFKNTIDYSETLEMSMSSMVVIDILASGKIKNNRADHKGMSLRFYEALIHQNKVITNNTNVIKQDFYHPNNIFIIGHDDINRLSDFIRTKYNPIPNFSHLKYSFFQWFSNKI